MTPTTCYDCPAAVPDRDRVTFYRKVSEKPLRYAAFCRGCAIKHDAAKGTK